MKNKHLVLIGGGHAHMEILANLWIFKNRGCRVTVVQPSDFHYYSGMGPGMLGGTYQPEQLRFSTRLQVESQGGRFIRDMASQIDPARQLVTLAQSAPPIPYDVLSCNAGSFITGKELQTTPDIFPVKPIEGLVRAQQIILHKSQQQQLQIAVIGGGPSAIEIAGNVRQLTQKKRHQPIIRIFAGTRLLRNHPPRLVKIVRKMLEQRKVAMHEGSYVRSTGNRKVVLEDGRVYFADIIFIATGVTPSPIFTASQLATGNNGGLLVNQYLQSTSHANIFGGGDCICFQPMPLAKVGVYAVRQNPVLLHNVMASLAGKKLNSFTPGGNYLSIYNLGNRQGLFHKKPIIFGGKAAFLIKDYIDRKFITKYSGSGK
jgi:NADH dehydrogenase FAD-containing subunit